MVSESGIVAITHVTADAILVFAFPAQRDPRGFDYSYFTVFSNKTAPALTPVAWGVGGSLL